jgi:hypothetical protein
LGKGKRVALGGAKKVKHIILSNAWGFSTEPFPAYRAHLSFGRNKQDEAFLAVTGVTPIPSYSVNGYNGDTIYFGTDRSAAEIAKTSYDREQAAAQRTWDQAKIEDGPVTLPSSLLAARAASVAVRRFFRRPQPAKP